jgi:hypothetical protein
MASDVTFKGLQGIRGAPGSAGRGPAGGGLLPLVYVELHPLARARLAR